MINSINHATNVQQRRVTLKKCGYSKAVRRYFLRAHSNEYKARINKLPSLLPKKLQR